MKKAIALLLMITLMMLSACDAGTPAASQEDVTADTVDLSAVMQDIRSKTELPEMMDLTDDNLLDYFGIDPQWVSDYAACINANGYEKDEIILLRAADEEALSRLQDALMESLNNAAAEMENYLPDQYALIQSSQVRHSGLYVWLFISNQSDKMQAVVDSYIS